MRRSITGGSPPFTGTFNPAGDLDDFNGQPAGGAWTISITDDANGETGTLLSWALTLNDAAATDCNTNGAADECDIAGGGSTDSDNDGVPDECDAGAVCSTCPGDTNGDGLVDKDDIQGFGDCIFNGAGCACTDMDGDGVTAEADATGDVAAFVEKLVIDENTACP